MEDWLPSIEAWLKGVELWMLIPWALVAVFVAYWAARRRRTHAPYWWEPESPFSSPWVTVLASLTAGTAFILGVNAESLRTRVLVGGAFAVFVVCAMLTTAVYKLELRRKGLQSPSAR